MTYPEHYLHFARIASGEGPVPTEEQGPGHTEPMEVGIEVHDPPSQRRDWEDEEPTKEMPAISDASLLQEWLERQEEAFGGR